MCIEEELWVRVRTIHNSEEFDRLDLVFFRIVVDPMHGRAR